MTREEMIVTLKTERAVAPLHTNAEKLIEALDMAIEMLQNFPRWRPLSEAISDDCARLTIIDNDGYVFTGYRTYGDSFMNYYGDLLDNENIKGWMPEGELDKKIFWR